MGVMFKGVYQVDDPAPDSDASGEFRRAQSLIRNWVTIDGSAGPTGRGGYAAETGRYHLFVAWNCPWAHRTLLVRAIKGIEAEISVSFARPRRTDQGWVFDESGPFCDPMLKARAVHQVYALADPTYTGRITVPVLFDKQTSRPVSNESADIIRMFNEVYTQGPDLYPAPLCDAIDGWNDLIYPTLNNGVYRAGFARTQAAYDRAVAEVFATLEKIETQLGKTRYLTGESLTEADLRLFPTLARFDVAYHYAFKCNLFRISDCSNLWAYAREIYQMPGVAGTVDFDIYKQGYFSPSELRNPLGIVPAGPRIDWNQPHGRD